MPDKAREESAEHLNARITIDGMKTIINDRLRDKDDAKDIRELLRLLLSRIEYLQKEHGYAAGRA